MASKLGQMCYLGWWFVGAKFFGKKKPLQSVIFISDRCNLQCKHCCVYNIKDPISKTMAQIEEELRYCYAQGSRFVDFEGGEPFLWKEGDKDINDLIRLAKKIGFFSCTITTNAQKPFHSDEANSIWVSLDGAGEYHDRVRGEGVFARLEKNVAGCGHKAVTANMAINTLNWESVAQTIEYVEANPAFKSISFSFHTPFPGTEHLALDMEKRARIVDLIISYKKKGYHIMNSKVGLRKMKKMDFKPQCWVTNFIYTDGTRKAQCAGNEYPGVCEQCGFGMAGEMNAVFNFHPETIVAGLSLRL